MSLRSYRDYIIKAKKIPHTVRYFCNLSAKTYLGLLDTLIINECFGAFYQGYASMEERQEQ